MTTLLSPAVVPTMYFIGVTTGSSSINRIFPSWAHYLGLGECVLRGLDFKVHADPSSYRTAVEFIKKDPLSLGALVTTHKIDLCAACSDLFDWLEPLSATMGEVSSLYKRDGKLQARAADPWTVGYALDSFVAPESWNNPADALVFGAGGSAVALAWHLSKADYGSSRPRHLHVADLDVSRLRHLAALHRSWNSPLALTCHQITSATTGDALVAALPDGSLIVNATGLGKDAPGSPLTDAVRFPARAIVWDFNYRGNLVFLNQARAQAATRHLHIEDGWTYFLHGWTRVMADVFNHEIPRQGPVFDHLSQLAAPIR